MTAIATLRIQTLTRRLDKCQLQMSLLSQQHKMITETTTTIGREYRQLYAQVNGLDNTMNAEYQDILSSKIGQLQDVYFVMYNKETDIETELKELTSEYQIISKELENLKKYNEDNAKKEVVRFS